MLTRADVVLYWSTNWSATQQSLVKVAPEGMRFSWIQGAGEKCVGCIKIAAMHREDGLWLFLLDPALEFPFLAENNEWEIFNSLSKRCLNVYSMPGDAALLQAHLRQWVEIPSVQEDPGFVKACRDMGLLGRAKSFLDALGTMARLARYDVPVLIEGETGTGKELFARALHYQGPRRDKPFVPINCGALPDTLLENELFGHARGAFTGAHSDARGLVQQADGGTLFFDEVHTLSPKGQVTLLRFLQDQAFRPVGGDKLRKTDVRIVAATNCDLRNAVSEGGFREDLFYRLEVATLSLPALRQRREDIPLLVENSLARLCRRFRTGPRRFDQDTLAWFCRQPWYGNVRELENQVCRAFLLSDCPEIHIDTVAAESGEGAAAQRPEGASFKETKERVLADFEAEYLRSMLERTCGNVTKAARLAGKDRRVFGRMMRKHGIDRAEFT